MKLLKKIMMATDFSKPADAAIQSAKLLARIFESEIFLIHVVPEDEGSLISVNMMTYIKMAEKRAEEMLFKIRANLVKEGLKASEPIVRAGVPYDRILREANVHNVDLIILAAGDKKNGERHHLGGTAERVIRAASRPVWIVKPDSRDEIKNILCPVDFSESSKRALTNAIHLARNLGADLTVLNVIQPPSGFYQGLFHKSRKEKAEEEKKRQRQFEEFLRHFDFHDVNWQRETRYGKPHREILNKVREEPTDLLAMGSVGKAGLEHMLIGGVARKVIREVPCSVLGVKPERFLHTHLEAKLSEIESHLDHGFDFLEQGHAKEARQEFEYCLTKDIMNVPAWEGLATAHRLLGHEEEFERCRVRAKYIRKALREKIKIEKNSE